MVLVPLIPILFSVTLKDYWIFLGVVAFLMQFKQWLFPPIYGFDHSRHVVHELRNGKWKPISKVYATKEEAEDKIIDLQEKYPHKQYKVAHKAVRGN